MFRLHDCDESVIKKIENKAVVCKCNTINSFLINFSYEVKRLRILYNGLLYIIYFGNGNLAKGNFDWTEWITTEEKIDYIVYEVKDSYSLYEDEVDDSALLNENEKIYIINKVNESKYINDNYILHLFIDKKLSLIEKQKFVISSDLKYLPLNIFEKYDEIVNHIDKEHQTSFFDDEDIPF